MVFGQSEWERICAKADESERIARFRTSAALSGALVKQCNVLFDFEPFPVRRRRRLLWACKHSRG